jgi:hypothetical protein
MNNQIIISVLILSIPSRLEKNLLPLYNKLLKQTENYPEVEILCLVDNKKMTIGEKRQSLLNISRGKWIFFLDDDDLLSEDFFETVIPILNDDTIDVITFNQFCNVNGHEFIVNFSTNNPNQRYSPDLSLILRPPFHMCIWNKNITKYSKFSDINYGEDYDWCKQMYPHIKSEIHINKILHYYNFSNDTSESIKLIEKNV